MFVRRLVTVALAVGALLVPTAAHAAAARGPVLDPSFGVGGWVSNDHGGGDYVIDLATQADGKILALGNANEGYFGIERHLPDGSIDYAFGTNGLVATDADPDSYWDDPKSITLLPDGRFLVAGSVSRAGFGAPVVIRYLADGTVDTTFGVDGRAFPALGDTVTSARTQGMVRQPDGRIVLAVEGVTSDGSPAPVALRLLPGGALDPSFGTGGVIRYDFGPHEFHSVRSLALAPDGDIVVAGSSGYYSTLPEPTGDLVVARFTPRGRPDATFGTNGSVVRDLTGPSGIDIHAGLAVGRDGRILQTAALQAAGSETQTPAMLRYLPTGKPDRNFGRNGVVTPTAGPVGAPVIRPNGKILTTGSISQNVALAQYRPDGRPDQTFGTNGVVVTDLGGYDVGYVVKIQPTGRLLVGGTGSSAGGTEFTLLRYIP
ncbi:hypothetical protein KOI35_36540 [Actinoplanes bogorensis]|uniref:Delta-60 repeat protein n=1 Tax=Paractinoplanes bogorensis TaxID=1610840 RepID=A0ABS5Z142_9ACTN|nr:hypothetical protein [Actinoplanes bogorensis]MBU2669036.1 hypothetical protein [Actinoplanes bogorensis]